MNKVAKFFRDYSFARFFIPAGILLLVFGIATLVIMNKNKNYIKTEAIVTKADLEEEEHYEGDDHYDATYRVYVKYTVDGTVYEEELGILSGYKVGDKVTIYYNPENPRQISEKVTILVPIIFIIGGVVSLVAGVISAVGTYNKNKVLKLQEEKWKNGN